MGLLWNCLPSHSTDSSNELLDLHTTQPRASEVWWSGHFSGHCVPNMFGEVKLDKADYTVV